MFWTPETPLKLPYGHQSLEERVSFRGVAGVGEGVTGDPRVTTHVCVGDCEARVCTCLCAYVDGREDRVVCARVCARALRPDRVLTSVPRLAGNPGNETHRRDPPLGTDVRERTLLSGRRKNQKLRDGGPSPERLHWTWSVPG